jgi:hypothetical protein
MIADKKLYFIPMIAQALVSDEPRRAMEEAFEEIKELGTREDYKEGFQQFMEFIKTAIGPVDETTPWQNVRLPAAAIHRLLYDLATDTFEGSEEQKEDLIASLKDIPEWNVRYAQLKERTQSLIHSNLPLEIEVLRKNQVIGAVPVSSGPAIVGEIAPGSYTVRFSNGRILWEGDLRKEDLIFAFAFPGKDFAMAAETEAPKRKPTKKLTLAGGDINLFVFAGLETGHIRLEIQKGIREA